MSIGMPGAGKTTALRTFALTHGYVYLCPDDIRQELMGDAADQTRNDEVWREAKQRVEEHLRKGETVVFDATFAEIKARQAFVEFAREHGAERIEGIHLDVPFAIAAERNRERSRQVPERDLRTMARKLRDAPPEITDGFDALSTLDAHQELVRAEKANREKLIAREFRKFH